MASQRDKRSSPISRKRSDGRGDVGLGGGDLLECRSVSHRIGSVLSLSVHLDYSDLSNGSGVRPAPSLETSSMIPLGASWH